MTLQGLKDGAIALAQGAAIAAGMVLFALGVSALLAVAMGGGR